MILSRCNIFFVIINKRKNIHIIQEINECVDFNSKKKAVDFKYKKTE